MLLVAGTKAQFPGQHMLLKANIRVLLHLLPSSIGKPGTRFENEADPYSLWKKRRHGASAATAPRQCMFFRIGNASMAAARRGMFCPHKSFLKPLTPVPNGLRRSSSEQGSNSGCSRSGARRGGGEAWGTRAGSSMQLFANLEYFIQFDRAPCHRGKRAGFRRGS